MPRFNTQPPEGGWEFTPKGLFADVVSTHSRPKAAGRPEDVDNIHIIGFNTQPPEGGWRIHDTV